MKMSICAFFDQKIFFTDSKDTYSIQYILNGLHINDLHTRKYPINLFKICGIIEIKQLLL